MILLRWLFKYWAPLVLAGGVVAFFYYDRQDQQLRERAKFTIGSLDGAHYTAKSGRFFDFHFTVNGTWYGGSSGRQAHMQEAPGTRYLVVYDSLNPAHNVGHFNVPIPANISAVPADGWRVPPFPVPAWLLDRGAAKK